MKKPGLLREAIAAFLPETACDPDRLAMWVERGNIRATGNRQHGFSWEYELIVVAENFTGAPEMLFYVIVEWARYQQPDLLAGDAPPIPFETNIIDDKTADVRITLALTEIVTVTMAGGAPVLTVIDETVPMLPDDTPLRAEEGPLTSIWAHDDDAPFHVAP